MPSQTGASQGGFGIKELGKQIGRLGAKFGSFTEGLALPSMEKILRDRFAMEVISPSVRVSKAGQHLKLATPENFQPRAF